MCGECESYFHLDSKLATCLSRVAQLESSFSSVAFLLRSHCFGFRRSVSSIDSGQKYAIKVVHHTSSSALMSGQGHTLAADHEVQLLCGPSKNKTSSIVKVICLKFA